MERGMQKDWMMTCGVCLLSFLIWLTLISPLSTIDGSICLAELTGFKDVWRRGWQERLQESVVFTSCSESFSLSALWIYYCVSGFCRLVTWDKSAYVHVVWDRTKAQKVCLLRVTLKNKHVLTPSGTWRRDGSPHHQAGIHSSHLILSGTVVQERGGLTARLSCYDPQ